MAFYDNPIVDKNSERSEESLLQVRMIFNRKAGFISREENPDNGVDLNIELVSANGATSNIFAIQIKSTSVVNTIYRNSVQYVSIEFKTSRLGHLCRRPPAYGIITIYDESSKITYFDFVEDIVNRLTANRGDEDWKEQENVSINIPLTVLNAESATDIHQKMSRRFNDHCMLLQAQGHLYRIPTFRKGINGEDIDFNDLKQVRKLLKDHGLELFNNKNFDMLLDLLGRLPSTMIIKSKELTLLAAITYGQTGMTIECDYYLQRSRLYSNRSEDEVFLQDYTTVMVEFKKGNLTSFQFSEGLVSLRQRTRNPLNALTLDINIIYSKFLVGDRDLIDETLLATINEVFPKIDQSNIPPTDKSLIKLFNLENLHNYGTGLLLRDAGKFKIQRKLGLQIPMTERVQRAKAIISVLNSATLQTHNILKSGIESNEKIVIALASYYKARFFFATSFQTMMLSADEKDFLPEPTAGIYEDHLNSCYRSISLFLELSMAHEAHQSLCCAYDLQVLYQVLHKSEVGSKSIAELEDLMRNIELDTGIEKYESIVESVHNSLSSERFDSEDAWASVPDDQVEKYARIVLDAYELPIERIVHIIADINAHKTFYRECTNPDLELLQDLSHHQRKETIYATSPMFIIRSKKSGIQSKKSSDINVLLDQFSTILKV